MTKRILLVQPGFGDRMVMKDFLYSLGYQVVGEVKDTDSALEEYGKLKPDFVIVDAVVPEVDGVVATTRLIRMDLEAKIIICVTRGQRSLAMESLAAGAKELIIKPFNQRQLHKALQSASR